MITAVWGNFAQHGDLPGKGINILHGEVHTSLSGYGKKMKYRIGRTAHGDIERHGIHECLFCSNGTRQNALVIIHIVCKCIFDYQFRTFEKEVAALLVSRKNSAVSGRSHTESLTETVHGVGCEHSAAASASWTCTSFECIKFCCSSSRIGAFDHYVHEIVIVLSHLSGLHRTSGYKYCRDIESHGSHQHTWSHLVAV